MRLTGFSIRRPPYHSDQRRSLDWVAEAHAESEARMKSLGPAERAAFAARMNKIVHRHSCGPDQIHDRGHAVADVGSTDWKNAELYDLNRHPRGKGSEARARFFDEAVTAYFENEYRPDATPPSHLIHVTCTGYVSPSGAQKVVARRGWGNTTRVTHAYHMGCYGAFPAVRIAAGSLGLPKVLASPGVPRVDIVHTELCSLHFDPSDHSLEQLVVQSLFADGFIRYSLEPGDKGPGLAVLALDERILPDSEGAMAWSVGDFGMNMTLSRDIPDMIAGSVRGVVMDLYKRAGIDAASRVRKSIFAVHPGGPKIIDSVRDMLELDEKQVHASREVLADHGNMSSATLPHVWARLAADPGVARGTLIASLAFGPGLTVCAGLFEKR